MGSVRMQRVSSRVHPTCGASRPAPSRNACGPCPKVTSCDKLTTIRAYPSAYFSLGRLHARRSTCGASTSSTGRVTRIISAVFLRVAVNGEVVRVLRGVAQCELTLVIVLLGAFGNKAKVMDIISCSMPAGLPRASQSPTNLPSGSPAVSAHLDNHLDKMSCCSLFVARGNGLPLSPSSLSNQSPGLNQRDLRRCRIQDYFRWPSEGASDPPEQQSPCQVARAPLKRTAAFLGPRPSFTFRFVAKKKGERSAAPITFRLVAKKEM